MDALNFVYWLQGFLELSNTKNLNEEQVKILKDHIKLVLEKKTPNLTTTPPPYHQPFVINTPNNIPMTPICSTNVKLDNRSFCSSGLTLNEGVSPLTFDDGVAPLTFEDTSPFEE
jgi:hypothetical protein